LAQRLPLVTKKKSLRLNHQQLNTTQLLIALLVVGDNEYMKVSKSLLQTIALATSIGVGIGACTSRPQSHFSVDKKKQPEVILTLNKVPTVVPDTLQKHNKHIKCPACGKG
jgi:hypothetical protein